MEVQQTDPKLPARISAKSIFRMLYEEAPGENRLFSPLSMEAAMAVLLAGAQGEAERVLREVLGVGDADTRLLVQALGDDIGRIRAGFDPQFRSEFSPGDFRLATGWWSREGMMKPKPELAQFLKKTLDIDFETLDFGKVAGAKDKLDRWVSRATNGKIRECPSPIDGETQLAGINALYVKASWISPFDNYHHRLDVFHSSETEEHVIPFMQLIPRGSHQGSEYFETDLFQALRLPLIDCGLVMDIFLPHFTVQLDELVTDFFGGGAEQWGGGFATRRKVFMLLPIFELKARLSMRAGTVGQKLEPVFRSGEDFASMFDFDGGQEAVELRGLDQTATLRVDREGIEGAAVTSFSAVLAGYEPYEDEMIAFEADRPFLFRVRHPESGRDLFVGTFMRPESKKGDRVRALTGEQKQERLEYRVSVRLHDLLRGKDQHWIRQWAAARLSDALDQLGLSDSLWGEVDRQGIWPSVLEGMMRRITQGKRFSRLFRRRMVTTLVSMGLTEQQAGELVREAILFPVLVRLSMVLVMAQIPDYRIWVGGMIRDAVRAGLRW